MTSFNPSNPIDSPVSVDGASDPLIPEAKVREGRTYTHLSSIQRLGRLIRIISRILLNSFGIALSPANASQISAWWNEFKQGRKINVARSNGVILSPVGSP